MNVASACPGEHYLLLGEQWILEHRTPQFLLNVTLVGGQFLQVYLADKPDSECAVEWHSSHGLDSPWPYYGMNGLGSVWGIGQTVNKAYTRARSSATNPRPSVVGITGRGNSAKGAGIRGWLKVDVNQVPRNGVWCVFREPYQTDEACSSSLQLLMRDPAETTVSVTCYGSNMSTLINAPPLTR